MSPTPPLSDREREVVRLLLEGKSNKQIAAALGIAVRTVEFHLSNLYAKHQVGSRTELVLKLRESTVANQGESPENRRRPNLGDWAASFKEAVINSVKELTMENTLNPGAASSGTNLTFFEAVRACLVKYADFDGRASRPEFWWFALFVLLVASALAYLSEVLSGFFLIIILLPLLAAGARRLHDTGRSGWWLLFLLAPVGGLVVLSYFWALPPVPALPDTN